MDRHANRSQDELELEIAKTRLRIAAERADPGRLLRQEVRASPLGSVATAAAGGLLLALLSRRERQGSQRGGLLDLLVPILSALR